MIFKKIVPWLFLVCTFLLFYGSLHTGHGYQNAFEFLLITFLYFRVIELEKRIEASHEKDRRRTETNCG
jgi:succinate-acetate transporter protein